LITTQIVNQIAKITLSAQIEYLSELIGFVSSISQKMGLDKTQSKHLELIREETCLNVIKHAFDPDEKGEFDAILGRKPGKIVVVVEDRGLPFDFSSFQPDDHKGLGMLPATMFFRKIQKKEEKKRQPAVFFYFRLQDGTPKKIFVPLHHRSIITKIIEINKLNREIDIESNKTEAISQRARLDVSVIPEHTFAFFTISNFGSDLIELVKFRLREMCLRKIDCIYIDLPLQDSRSRLFCAELEMLGFFFAGVIPEMKQGDILRL
jgi:anti-sigma regulatory factor (Ser/Thr protein kinase)